MTELELQEFLITMPYVGLPCPHCGHVVEHPADLKNVRFGLAGDVVCKPCWDAYNARLVYNLRDALIALINMARDGNIAITPGHLKRLKKLVRYGKEQEIDGGD